MPGGHCEAAPQAGSAWGPRSQQAQPLGEGAAHPSISSPTRGQGMGLTTLGTASVPTAGLHTPPASCTPKGGCLLARESTVWLMGTAGFMSSSPNRLSFLSPSPPPWQPQGARSILGPQHFAKAMAAPSHSPPAQSQSHDSPTPPNCLWAHARPRHPAGTQLPWHRDRGTQTHHPGSPMSHRGCSPSQGA